MTRMRGTQLLPCIGIVALCLGMPGTAPAIEFRQLTFMRLDQAALGSPSWSPDGSHIACGSIYFDPAHPSLIDGWIDIVRVVDGAFSTFPSQGAACSSEGVASEPDWSPLGDRIVFNCFNRSPLWIGSVAETLATQLSAATSIKPSWSPDGTQIAVTREDGIVLLPVADGLPQVLTGGPDSSPAWSPDGNWIAFSSSRNGRRDIWIVPAAGGTPQPLNNDARGRRQPLLVGRRRTDRLRFRPQRQLGCVGDSRRQRGALSGYDRSGRGSGSRLVSGRQPDRVRLGALRLAEPLDRLGLAHSEHRASHVVALEGNVRRRIIHPQRPAGRVATTRSVGPGSGTVCGVANPARVSHAMYSAPL